MGGVGVANNKRSRYRGVTLFKQSGKFRAQISSNGKTTSLGDHLTEEEAARAFDRACIHRSGTDANTNFPLSDYATELQALQSMSQRDLVAMLRASARRQVTQTSVYMGVSLLRQTGRWHSQISWHTTISSSRESILNLGYYASEEAAARAYDRAALIKATTTAAGSDPEIKSEKDDANEQEQEEEARPSSSARPLHSAERASTPPALNFPPSNYASDAQLPAALLLSALTGDSTRKLVMDMLENGISEEGIGHLNRMLTEGGGGGGGGGENQKRKIKGVNGNGGGLNDGCGEGNNSGGDDDGGSDDGGGGGGGGIVKGQAAAIVEAAIAAEGRLGALLANGSHPNNMQLHTPPVLFNSMLEVGGGLSSGNGGGGGSESSRKRRKTTRPARSHAN